MEQNTTTESRPRGLATAGGAQKHHWTRMVLSSAVDFLFVTAAAVLYFMTDEIDWTFYPGVLGGVLFGLGTRFYLEEIWSREVAGTRPPAHVRSEGCAPRVLGLAMGLLVIRIVLQFVGNRLQDLVLGLVFGWLILTLGYLTIIKLQHRLKA